METPESKIPPERVALYQVGMALSVIGYLLFFSSFLIFIAGFGDFDGFGGRMKMMMICGFGGGLIIAGGRTLMSVAARGLAGSGLILDPQRARKDVEPWSRMAGGVISDALSEVGARSQGEEQADASEPQVKIRCQRCHALNDESAKFCNQCGAAL
jgi:hypothetical protein